MNFDRVSAIYDATRAIPDTILAQATQRIVAATHAGTSTKFLELGIGTGRIALPLILAGFDYTGIDISEQMMAQLRAKLAGDLPNLTLIRADVTDLPLPDDSIDVVLTVHLLHLVPEWQMALAEARRVLRPGGYFVMGRDWPAAGDPGEVIRHQWRTLVEQRGVALRADHGNWDAVDAELTRQGGRTSVYRVGSWPHELRPIDLLDDQKNRVFSLSWDVPDDVLEEVHTEMLAWATQRYNRIDTPMRVREEFLLSVTQFSG
ncbi:MAG: class I SAM-dependent methyltransferase [Chloroflexota bacterium]